MVKLTFQNQSLICLPFNMLPGSEFVGEKASLPNLSLIMKLPGSYKTITIWTNHIIGLVKRSFRFYP